MHELLEDFVARNEIRFAQHFDHDTDFAAAMDIGVNDALGRDAVALPVGLGNAFLAEQINGFLHVTARLFERALGVQDAGVRQRPQLHDLFCVCHRRNIILFPFPERRRVPELRLRPERRRGRRVPAAPPGLPCLR